MSNVPMTRPEEMLAEHKTGYFHDSTFVELSGDRILHSSGGKFSVSDDGGITWSKDFTCRDSKGNAVGGGFIKPGRKTTGKPGREPTPLHWPLPRLLHG